MKTNGILITLLALALAACEKNPTAKPTPPMLSEEALTPAQVPTRPALTATPSPEIALPGRYWLRHPISTETDSGIARFLGATPLIATEVANRYRTADGHTITVAATSVTNDLTEVRQIVAARQASRSPLSPPSLDAPVAAVAPRPTASATPAPRYVEPVRTGPGGIQASSALGASHSRTDDGILWQKSPDGKYWVPVKWLRTGINRPLPPDRPAD